MDMCGKKNRVISTQTAPVIRREQRVRLRQNNKQLFSQSVKIDRERRHTMKKKVDTYITKGKNVVVP